MKRAFFGIGLALALVLLGTGAALADLNPVEQLGKDLFFDDNLSTPPGQSCAACHAPNTAFVGPDSEINAHGAVYPGAVHKRFGNRKPPSAAYASFSPDFYYDEIEGLYIGGMFWDGRAANTIEQAKGPFLNPVEQNNPNMRHVIIKVLKSDYADAFKMLYAEWVLENLLGGESMPELSFDLDDDAFIADAYQFTAEAIAIYEASSEVNQFSSKYDAYLAGETMLTPQEMWGLELYEGKAMCAACHPSQPGPGGEPPLFTDFTYDNLGVPRNPENPWYTMPKGFNPEGIDWTDYGLGAIVGEEDEMGKMKVPTLRNVGMRPYDGFVQAYMHNGVFKSLEDVVHFYNTRDVEPWPAPEVAMNVNVDELGDLGLTPDEEAAIVAFMNTLTDGWTGAMTSPARAGDLRPAITLNASPNPFAGSTVVRFSAGAGSVVDLDIYDVGGRRVRGLISGRELSGDQAIAWDGRDDRGLTAGPGIYFLRLKTGAATTTLRTVRLN